MKIITPEIATLFAFLQQNRKKVIITVHQSPDGDAIGSGLALYNLLRQKDIECDFIVPDDFPDFLHWLPGSQEILVYEKNPVLCNEIIHHAGVFFFLDFNQYSRLRHMQVPVEENNEAVRILIDHHQQPQIQAHYTFVDTEASSTCELIFQLIKANHGVENINKEIATCLYCGLLTDTGSFRFASATAETFEIAAFLIRRGADNASIYANVFDTYSHSRLRLLGHILKDKMKLYEHKKAALITLSKEELSAFNYRKGDTEGFVNYPLSIKDIHFSALITEREDGEVKISFRSKGNIDVNQIARKHFNGGGHLNAAGANSSLSLQDTVAKVEYIILHEL